MHILATDYRQFSDAELLARYRSTSDTEIVGELFNRHALMCFAVCNKYLQNESLAEDAAMTVFEKLFKDLLHQEIQNFKSWLHTVCKNHCLMHLRKPLKTIRMDDYETESSTKSMDLPSELHPYSESLEKEKMFEQLEQALAQLNEKQKRCVELFYLQQKSYEEVARLTGYSPEAVKSYIQNGKRNLKNILKDKGTLPWIISWIFTQWIV